MLISIFLLQRLNPIQELQLLEVLLDYFAAGEDKVVLNTVFMMLFTPPHSPSPSPSPSPSGGPRNDLFGSGTLATAALSDRMRILARLVSAAVATKNLAVLNCTGVWMQQLGCLSQHSLNLSRVLIEDYFVLHTPQSSVSFKLFLKIFALLHLILTLKSSCSTSCLEQLPQLAPHFTACFLTAAAELYGGLGMLYLVVDSSLKISINDCSFRFRGYPGDVRSAAAISPRCCRQLGYLQSSPLLDPSDVEFTSTATQG